MSKKKHILIPIHLNEQGAGVVAYGVSLARDLGLGVKLLHVLSMHGVPSPVTAHAGTADYNVPIGEITEEKIKLANTKLEALATRIKEESRVRCEYECTTGFVDIQILEHTEQGDIAMVVMGTPRSDTLLNQLLGSRSLKVVNHSKTPVLLVPKLSTYLPVKKIVVGVSYQDYSSEQNRWLLQMASALQADLHFVRIVEENTDKQQLMFDGYQKQLQSSMPEGTNGTFKLLRESSIDEGLRNYRRQVNADLIALQRSGKSAWDHLFATDVSQELALDTSVPLLVY